IICGGLTSKFGVYRPFIWGGLAIATVGCGLLTLLEKDTDRGKIIGFLFVNGVGLGACMQSILLAIQSSVPHQDIAVATANATFFRTIGSVLGIAIIGTVFNNKVRENLKPLVESNPDL